MVCGAHWHHRPLLDARADSLHAMFQGRFSSSRTPRYAPAVQGIDAPEDQWGVRAPRRKGFIYCVAIGGAVAVAAVAVVLVLLNGPSPPNRLDVWIDAGAPAAEVHAIEQATTSIRGVSSCQFWSQERDYLQALKLLGASRSSVLTERSIPSSFRCEIPPGSSSTHAIDEMEVMPGVFRVTNVPSVGTQPAG